MLQFRGLVSLGLFAFALSAQAGESPFGWIYTADLTPKGAREYEHKSFLQNGQSKGEYSYWKHAEEIEFGVTDNLQVSFYLNWSQVNASKNGVNGETGGPGTDLSASDNPFGRFRQTRVDTVSSEIIYRLMNPYTDSFGLALYLEPEIGPKERELEWRVILQKNYIDDRLTLATNITGVHEREEGAMELEKASMLDLTFGGSYRFINNWSAGLEARNHQEFLGYGYQSKEHSAWFLGPNIHYGSQKFWVTAAWRHQMPWVKGYSQDQRDEIVSGRIYGDEHARNEFMVKVGVPF